LLVTLACVFGNISLRVRRE